MGHQTTNKAIPLFLSFVSLSVLTILGSCYYDNEEELYPNAPVCDTVNITYSGSVAPIMSANCNACHGGSAPSAGVKTDTYAGLSVVADNGRLWGAINHQQGFSFMPKDAPQLSECDLTKIRKWLDDGFPEN